VPDAIFVTKPYGPRELETALQQAMAARD
jgi:hypothetical protein